MRSQKRPCWVDGVEVVEVGVEVALVAGRAIGAPTQVGAWTPLVMPEDLVVGMMPCHVAFAVSAWSWLTALAPFVRRSENAVMSNWPRSPSVPTPELEDPVDRDAAAVEQRAGDAPDEIARRSARCRPRPACGS